MKLTPKKDRQLQTATKIWREWDIMGLLKNTESAGLWRE